MGLLEYDAFRSLTRVIDPAQPTVFLDVGANRGDTVLRWREEFTRSHVVAFEPAPVLAGALRTRFRADDAVRVVAAAAGDASGEVNLVVTKDDRFSSVLPPSELGRAFHPGAIEPTRTVRTPIVTLDEWAIGEGVDHVDAIKIDVQGHEAAVIRGASGLLRSGGVLAVNCEAQLVREYDGASTYAEIDTLLNAHGFELHQVHECWACGPEQQTTCIDGLWLRRDALRWVRAQPSRGFEIGWRERLLDELHACARAGYTRVALYGAGYHTRAVASVFESSPVPVVAVLDDDPSGRSIAGAPVVSPDDAVALGVDAVILSSNVHEEALWSAAAPLRLRGVDVRPLYRRHASPGRPAVTTPR